jgi:endonuclease G
VVPDGFFKAVLRQEGENYKSIAFVFENDSNPQPISKAVVSVNDVESLVGYDLFANLDDQIEEIIEAQSNWEDWAK